MPDLSGKVAIVTGSTRGIGLAIAEALIRSGASVTVTGRKAKRVEETVARLAPYADGQVLGVPCDVRDPERCEALVEETVQRLGRLDVLVNNAGVGVFRPVLELTVEDWQLQIDTNLGGVFYCSRAAAPHLAATGDGFIINIGSLAGRNPVPGGAGYNASKFGLVGMSEAMMLDLRYEGVRVSVVMPGSVNTHFNEREPLGQRDWRLEGEDCAMAVLQLLEYPQEAHVSRIEMRPSQPKRRSGGS